MSDGRDYLLDTNMLGFIAAVNSGSIQPREQLVAQRIAHIRETTNRKLFISAITQGECEYGLLIATQPNTKRHQDARAVVDAFLPGTVLPVDGNVAKAHYAFLRASLFARYAPKNKRGLAKKEFIGEWVEPTTQKELGIQENDLWIAAIALAYNLTLVTDDKMERIRSVAPGLAVENWLVAENCILPVTLYKKT